MGENRPENVELRAEVFDHDGKRTVLELKQKLASRARRQH